MASSAARRMSVHLACTTWRLPEIQWHSRERQMAGPHITRSEAEGLSGKSSHSPSGTNRAPEHESPSNTRPSSILECGWPPARPWSRQVWAEHLPRSDVGERMIDPHAGGTEPPQVRAFIPSSGRTSPPRAARLIDQSTTTALFAESSRWYTINIVLLKQEEGSTNEKRL